MAKDEKKAEKVVAEVSPDEAAGKSKKRKLLLIVVGGVVLTAGVGGGLAFFLGRGGDAKMAAKTGEAAEGGEEHEKKDEKGEARKEGKEEKGKKEEKGEARKEGKEEKGKKEEKGEGKKEEKGEGKKEEKGEGKKEGKEKDKDTKMAALEGVDFGCTTALQPFHLNLGNPLENRYVRLEIAVEYGCNEETKAELDRRLPQLRDAIIAVTSRKTREFLLGPDGKEQLRKEVHNRLNHYMTRKIDDVFITDILIE